MAEETRPHVAVVGGGIAGLAAAWHLNALSEGAVRVTVFEASDAIGGKLRTSEVGGLTLDEGAESMLLRRHEAVTLTHAVGLGPDVVHASTAGAALWIGNRLRPLPPGQLMGIPGDLRALAASGVLSVPALARIPLDHLLPRTPVRSDVSLGRFVAARVGREVVDRLVEPILGGVYAGHADDISLDAALPQLSGAVRVERSLLRGVQQVLGNGRRRGTGRPAFASLRGGLGRLPLAVAAGSGAHIRTRATVRELRRSPGGWRLTVGSARAPESVFADAVVLATPAAPTSRLLRDVVPTAATELAAIEYASVGLVTFVFPRAALPHGLDGTGFLVPPSEQRVIKAATFSTSKWGWLAEEHPDLVAVRVSVGRHREEQDLQRDDAELAWVAQSELAAATGILDAPIDTRVTRWGGALPQYAVGHLDRVDRIRRAVATQPGLAVCGAAYEGVGIPACIQSGERAATRVLAEVAQGEQWVHA